MGREAYAAAGQSQQRRRNTMQPAAPAGNHAPAPAPTDADDEALLGKLHWDGGAGLEQELGERVNDPTALVPIAMQTKKKLQEIEQRLQMLSNATELTELEAKRKRSFEEAGAC